MVTRATVWSLFSITEGGAGGTFPVLFSLEMGGGGGGGMGGRSRKKDVS